MVNLKIKPILFNTKMVQAILDGRKTVTRRLVKPRYRDDECGFQVVTNAHTGNFIRIEKLSDQGCDIFPDGSERHVSPPCQPGDILYVRETWCLCYDGEKYFYLADKGTAREESRLLDYDDARWRPSIHMPKEAARVFLRVTAVRAEHLQDIMKDPPGPTNQIVREGCAYGCDFIAVWQNTIKKKDLSDYGWDANPWVWVIEFERCEKPEGF